MRTVQFLKEYVAPDGREFRKGEVVSVTHEMASDLMRAGIVQLRVSPEPYEKKEGT